MMITDMQENMWARLRDSRPGACLIHATKPTYFPAFLYLSLERIEMLFQNHRMYVFRLRLYV